MKISVRKKHNIVSLFQNLKEIRANPLLNVSNLENRFLHNGRELPSTAHNNATDDEETYDYHAAQLER